MAKRSKALAAVFAKLQNWTQTTRSELLFVTFLLSGLLAGLVFTKVSRYHPEEVSMTNSELQHVMDSLAIVEASTYTGVTPNAEPVPELAKGDTLLKQGMGTGFGGNQTRGRKAGSEKISTGTIKLNTATVRDLMRLPGVGEATAEKILAERTTRRFTRIEDVMRVKGIGKKKFEAMKPFLEL